MAMGEAQTYDVNHDLMDGEVSGERSSLCSMLGLLLALVLLPGLPPSEAHAQTTPLNESWRWIPFTTTSGLPSNTILDIIETTEGTPWVLTPNGLAWYDAFRWHPIEVVPGGSEQSLLRLVPDLAGGVFVVADEQLYQGGRNGFTPVPLVVDGEAIPVWSVVPVAEESLLIASHGQLFSYESGRITPIVSPSGFPASDHIDWLLERTKSGRVWLSASPGLYEWIDGQWHRALPGRQVGRIREDSLGTMMVVQLTLERRALWTMQSGQAPVFRKLLGAGYIISWAVAPGGDAIIGYTSGQIEVRSKGQWRLLDPIPEPMTGLRVVLYHSNGDLWLGTNNGLFLHRSTNPRWHHWTHADPAPGEEEVSALLQTQSGAIWVGTQAGLHIHHTDGSIERIDEVLGFSLHNITGLAQDADGGIWVSSGGALPGAFRWYDEAWQHFGPEEGLLAARIHRIVQDRRGRLWFLGLAPALGGSKTQPEQGAFVYDGKGFTQWGPDQGLLHGRAYSFAEGPDGAYWFGTFGGISRWHNGEWSHWTKQRGLKANRVFTVAVTPDNTLWFGHGSLYEFGLGYLDEKEQPRYVTTMDGLVDNRVWELHALADSTLWIGTHRGLALHRNGIFSAFDQITESSNMALWPILPLEDRVLMGTLGEGVYELNVSEAFNPPPRVEIAPPLLDTDRAVFRWQAFAFQGELPTDRIETRYRFDDNEWSAWSTTREVGPVQLSSGRHRFTVQAKSLFGTVNTDDATVTFRIAPPLYQHPLILTTVVLWLASMIGLGIVSWRKQRRLFVEIEAKNTQIEKKNTELESRNITLENQNAELERFTYIISHDLKTPLVTIKGFLGLLKQDAAEGNTERIEKDIAQIGDAADKMARLLNELLELSRIGRLVNPPEMVSLNDLASEAAGLINGAVRARGVTVEIEEAMPVVYGDRVRLLEVYQNLIDNAVKFMGGQPEPRIRISAQRRAGKVLCYVQDNGVGIAPTYHENVFGLFNRLDQEVEGTGIGLALVKRIVEVHGGEVWVESEGEGEGSTFYFTLPHQADRIA